MKMKTYLNEARSGQNDRDVLMKKLIKNRSTMDEREFISTLEEFEEVVEKYHSDKIINIIKKYSL